MTMILPLLSDLPIDMLVVGEIMRDAALSWPMTDAAGLAGENLEFPLSAAINAPSSVMAGLSAYPPMASNVATTFDGRPIATATMASRANGGICTPDGVTVPFTRTNSDLMTCYTPQSTQRWVLSIITQDAAGSPIGGCRVIALNVGQMAVGQAPIVDEEISDGSGNATMNVPLNTDYMVIAYLPGSPDRAGVSVQTLSPDAV